MFTAKIKSIAKHQGKINLVVEYSDGSESFEEVISASFSVDMNWLKGQIKGRIDSLTSAYAFADSLSVDQQIDATTAPLTQAELDRNTFLQTYEKWLRVKRAIDAEVLTGNETKVVELKNKVQADFRPAYLDLI